MANGDRPGVDDPRTTRPRDGLFTLYDHRAAAERLQHLRLRDLLLHPRRVLDDARETGALANRLRNRWLETFFSDDTRDNRLARDGFFDGVDGVRAHRVLRHPVVADVSRDMLRIDFLLKPGEDVAARKRQLDQVVRDFTGMLEDA